MSKYNGRGRETTGEEIEGDNETLDLGDMFTEPPRPPTPESKFAVYTREPEQGGSGRSKDGGTNLEWEKVRIRLVGSHPLWAHYLWNASLALASFLDAPSNRALYLNKNVLELGAGGSLPSIVCALNGSERGKVVITDYPDESLIENIKFNVDKNVDEERRQKVFVKGYIWGQSPTSLLSILSDTSSSLSGPNSLDEQPKFDLIILSDLIFNHSQHEALLNTCESTLSTHSNFGEPSPCVLVFYSHHRPHLAHRDMEFFDKSRERGWVCEEVVTRVFPPMFPKDSGEESVRATVHGWKLTRRC